MVVMWCKKDNELSIYHDFFKLSHAFDTTKIDNNYGIKSQKNMMCVNYMYDKL